MPIVLEYSIKTNWYYILKMVVYFTRMMSQRCRLKVSDNISFVIILGYDWIVVLKYYVICSYQNLLLNCFDILLFLIKIFRELLQKTSRMFCIINHLLVVLPVTVVSLFQVSYLSSFGSLDIFSLNIIYIILSQTFGLFLGQLKQAKSNYNSTDRLHRNYRLQ